MTPQNKIYLWVFIIFILVGGGIAAYFGLQASGPTAPSSLTTTTPVAKSCGTLPLDVMLVIDRSGSMGGNALTDPGSTPKLTYAKQAAKDLITQLDTNGAGTTGGGSFGGSSGGGNVGGASGQNHVGIVSFGGPDNKGVTLDVPLVNALGGSSTATDLNKAVDSLSANGATPFRQAMSAAASEMTQHKRTTVNGKTVQHVIIFLSDGAPDPAGVDPNGNEPNAADITSFTASADMIYSIAIGAPSVTSGNTTGTFGATGGGSTTTDPGLVLMQKLAKPASKYHFITSADQLPALFGDIYTEIACSSADLALTKTVSNSAPNQNDSVAFTVKITNTGPNDTEGVTVKDVLPTGLTYVAGADKTYDGTTWTVGALKSGDSASLTINATITAAAGTALTNTATVASSSVSDPNSANDNASATLTVATAAVTTTPPTNPTTPTTPVTPTTPTAPTTTTTTTPTAAPASGFGGYGQLLYALLGLLGCSVLGFASFKLLRKQG